MQRQVAAADQRDELADRVARLNQVNNTAVDNIHAAQQVQVDAYRKRRNITNPATDMPPGSLVWQRKPPSAMSSKLDSPLEGPYRVVAWNDSNSIANIEDGRGNRWSASAARLSPYEQA